MGNIRRSITYWAITLQYLAVLLGIAWWSAATGSRFRGHSLAYWPIAGLLSVILLGVALCRAYVTGRRATAAIVAGNVCYAILLILSDPFVWIEQDQIEGVLCVAVILPPILCIKPLVQSRAWLAVCGVVLFSTAAVACLLFNGTACAPGGWLFALVGLLRLSAAAFSASLMAVKRAHGYGNAWRLNLGSSIESHEPMVPVSNE